jgi:ABC-type transport system involved in cytochrome c biogenesis permease subunit
MNHPLRHQGETFYQQSTMASETASGEKKDTGTVLQVVKNPGWILPYVSCIVVALGMLIHFGIGIVKFAGKRTVVQKSAILTPTTLFQKILPWAIIAILGFYALGKMAPRNQKHNDFDVTRFGSIPVLDSGRIKPLDSVARTTMLYISGRSEWQDIDGKTQPASLWLLEVLAAGDPHAKPIADYRVFRIDNDQVLNQLELPYRPGSLRYSWNEIRNTGDKFERAFAAAQLRSEKKEAGEKVPEDDRNIFHGKILELARRLHVYEQLATYKTPTLIPKEKGSTEWQTLDSIDREAGQPFEQVAQEEVFDEVMDDLRKNGIDPKNLPRESQLRLIQKIKMLTAMRVREFGVRGRAKVSPGAAAFSNILTAYKENQPNKFSEAIDTYTSEYVLPINSEFKDRTKFEIAFNSGAPFINAAFMYLFAIVLIALSWLGWRGPLRKAAIGVALIALVLHAFGLIGRMYITDRYFVFVTNLYSTGIMIGFAAVAGCLVIERIFQNGIGLMAGASLGAITGKIAHHLATDGSDTMGSLVAVLDTNFWLASHVTTVILGYTATLISGLIGMAFIYQMLARVVVQSFQTAQAMTWDKAVAYIAAVLGIVLIPNLFVSIWITGLSTEELVSPIVSQILMYFTLGAGGVAGFVLLILRFALVSIDTGSRSSQLPAIARALQNSALDNEAMTKLGQMTYGVVCFATLLSFVGTVLGGIWADQSWGRFWGWDPKENGAVLIVIWNSLILHARWSGLVKQRGVAVLAVVGIMVTTWSWFGTNQLGVGLHNYGFNETLAEGCRWTWIICAIVIGVGLVPFKYWNSFGTGLPRPESAASSSISTSGLGTSQPQGKRSGKNR